jgi:hypothetical protein
MLTAALLATGAAHAQTSPIEDLPSEMVQQLGRAMYEQDAYAAQATDLLFREKGGPERLAQEGLRGDWVVTRVKDSTLVRFLRDSNGKALAAYEVVFPQGQLPYLRRPADGRVSEAALAQLRARRLAMEQVRDECSQRYNTIALQRGPDANFLVYAMAATSDPSQIVVGGHYRVTVTPDGRKVVKTEKLFRSCLNLPAANNAGAIPWLTHVVSARPLETHVFMSLAYGRPFYVRAGTSAWKVDKGLLTPVELPKQQAKAGPSSPPQ